ncbi:GFA family protein [Aquamicrobium sp. LC103]|uniref:GFA family protein n=1 Tax=Aquamicrobium sp. LC103 TaxID=1120658 RepID=UPI00063EC2EF|nr:GFA family protein [Aquamicrobium sp. LC103]TKT74986.1 GFA family protein [Aquamicrobium sp. LC103]
MLTGSCHCGEIKFEVDGEMPAEALECNCSHCSRKGYLLWFVPRAALALKTPEEKLSTYHFNRHVIDHHFCGNCGCAPFGFGTDSKGNAMASVNIRCIEGVELTEIKRIPVDGRSF